MKRSIAPTFATAQNFGLKFGTHDTTCISVSSESPGPISNFVLFPQYLPGHSQPRSPSGGSRLGVEWGNLDKELSATLPTLSASWCLSSPRPCMHIACQVQSLLSRSWYVFLSYCGDLQYRDSLLPCLLYLLTFPSIILYRQISTKPPLQSSLASLHDVKIEGHEFTIGVVNTTRTCAFLVCPMQVQEDRGFQFKFQV